MNSTSEQDQGPFRLRYVGNVIMVAISLLSDKCSGQLPILFEPADSLIMSNEVVKKKLFLLL